ncbi:MAG: GAF domain-containing protein [Chloroflexi bacterium]|nr:GAF domain-containing protein [Chloroflexota bacterium]
MTPEPTEQASGLLTASVGEAALEHILRALVQMPSPREVVQATLEAAQQLTRARDVYLLLREDQALRLEAALGFEVSAPVTLPLGRSIEGRVASTGVAVTVCDATQEPDYCHLPGRDRSLGALAVVPLLLRGNVIGVLACARAAAGGFTPEEVCWLQHLADILGVAVENARLLDAERRSRSQAEILSQLASFEGNDLPHYCQWVVETITPALSVDQAHIVLLDAGGRGARISSSHRDGHQQQFLAEALAAPDSPLGRALRSGEPLVVADSATDPPTSAFGEALGLRSLMAVPIPSQSGPRGMLLLAGRAPHRFGVQDAVFLQFIAERIGLVLHRAEVEREQARAQARQEFLSVVSHELRTPLAVIKAYCEVLERRTASHTWEADDDRVLANIAEQVALMQGMVEQLLDLRRLDAGVLPLELSRFDLVALVGRVAEVLQATTQRHRVVVEPGAPVLVVADRGRIHQVLSNLIENAIKYSPAGGEIAIAVRAVPAADGQSDAALVTVTDHGLGLAPEDIPRAFDRFYQGQQPSYRGRRGLGLGLYIAREIVERHGGAIWAESEPGKGATFALTLPLAGPETEG